MSRLTSKTLEAWKGNLQGSYLSRGDQGEDIYTLQLLLNSFGFDLSIDGDFGPQTEELVEKFQEKRIILPDSIVGPMTIDELIHCWEKGWNLTEVPFLHRSGIYVYGPKHPFAGSIPDVFGAMSTFGGPNDWGDLMYGQSLIAAQTPDEVKRKYPQLVDAGIFRKDVETLPRIKNPHTGKMVQTGISWMLNPKSYYLAMRWSYAQRTLMSKDPSKYPVLVGVPSRNLWVIVCPTDYGPAKWTKRIADLSYGATDALATDDSGKIIEDGISLKTDSKVVCGWVANQIVFGPVK